MAERNLLPGEYIVLGLLAIRPMYAYEMSRHFEAEGLAEVLPIEQSMLYTYVRNVEERGLVVVREEERVGKRPPRKIFALTAEGLGVIRNWLAQPVERMREVRIEFLLKMYFLHELDAEGERYLLRQQIDVCDAYQARLAMRLEDAAGFERLVLRSKVSAAESTGRWLREYAWELDHATQPEEMETE